MRANRKKALRNQLIRDDILDAALHLYTRDGYFNTSIHDIQREAGVSIGSIYNNFGGKEAVAKALYGQLVGHMENVVDAIASKHATAHNRCRAVVEVLFDMTERETETVGFILNAKHKEFLPDEPPICSSQPFVKLRDMIQAGIDAGQMRPMDPWVAAACTFGPALRMIQLRLDGMIAAPLPDYLDELWLHSWRTVGVDPVPEDLR
ncbi:MAG: TetR/AcrR family transcriptional regulator [Gammaproteobacteria bacterium]|nr:TetR/AcrR family transcriptional regulator [Gammaproteobacteria bacterium]